MRKTLSRLVTKTFEPMGANSATLSLLTNRADRQLTTFLHWAATEESRPLRYTGTIYSQYGHENNNQDVILCFELDAKRQLAVTCDCCIVQNCSKPDVLCVKASRSLFSLSATVDFASDWSVSDLRETDLNEAFESVTSDCGCCVTAAMAIDS